MRPFHLMIISPICAQIALAAPMPTPQTVLSATEAAELEARIANSKAVVNLIENDKVPAVKKAFHFQEEWEISELFKKQALTPEQIGIMARRVAARNQLT